MFSRIVKQSVKKVFPGISWQNPITNFAFRLVDPADAVVRTLVGRSQMPPYSIRVRSNGVTEQFGGKKFQENGLLVRKLLIDAAGINPHSNILEVGCGCGRTAIALAEYLDDGRYTGVDIERKSLEACNSVPSLNRDGFDFQVLDVYNAEYNPMGQQSASEYRFPFMNGGFDTVFLVSVFTHMLPEDVEHYVSEIGRILSNNGTCLITTFLMDRGTSGKRISFPFSGNNYYFNNQAMPEVAIGYMLSFFERCAAASGMELSTTIWGTWRDASSSIVGEFPQDVIVLKKRETVQ